MDLFTIILIVGAAYLGWVARGVMLLTGMSDNPDKFIKILEEIKKINNAEAAGFEGDDAVAIAQGIKVRAEEVGGIFYIYDLKDNQFIAQGNSVEDAFKLAQKRFPGKSFWLEQKNISSQTA